MDEHIDIIVQHWTSGLGLFIFGDSDQYYVDVKGIKLFEIIILCGAVSPDSR